MITHKKAIEAAKTIVQYCKEQGGCQNCIFRLFACDHWDCSVDAFDLADIIANLEAKKKNHGWI